LFFGPLAQITGDAGDQLFQPVPAPEDFGPCKSAAGQVRLKRLDQTPLLFSVQIALDGSRAGEAVHATLAGCGLRLFETIPMVT